MRAYVTHSDTLLAYSLTITRPPDGAKAPRPLRYDANLKYIRAEAERMSHHPETLELLLDHDDILTAITEATDELCLYASTKRADQFLKLVRKATKDAQRKVNARKEPTQ